jgi:hypothetical protein
MTQWPSKVESRKKSSSTLVSLLFCVFIIVFFLGPQAQAQTVLSSQQDPQSFSTLSWRNTKHIAAPKLRHWKGQNVWLIFFDNPKTFNVDYLSLLKESTGMRSQGVLFYAVLAYDETLPAAFKISDGSIPVGLDQYGMFSLMFGVQFYPHLIHINRQGQFAFNSGEAKIQAMLFDFITGEEERSALDLFFEMIFGWIQQHPMEFAFVLMAIGRLLATRIETGWSGVLFTFGRVNKVLGPGVYPLFPWVWQVRKVRNRSITLDVAKQKVTNADGLVYEVDVNLVYRINDPIKALVEIDDLKGGCETALALSVQQLIGRCSRKDLQSFGDLDDLLTEFVSERLTVWGVTTERAGFTSIAPDLKTLRLSQLKAKTKERQTVLNYYLEEGIEMQLALELLGSERSIFSHSSLTYRTASSLTMTPLRRQFFKSEDKRIRQERESKKKTKFAARRSEPNKLTAGTQ